MNDYRLKCFSFCGIFVASILLPHPDLISALIRSVVEILAGGGSLFLVAWTYEHLTGKEGMGMGDVKLLGMIGALLGWQGVLFTIFTGSSAGCLLELVLMMKHRGEMKMAVPFGPFLSLGVLLHVFWGADLINWYLNPLL